MKKLIAIMLPFIMLNFFSTIFQSCDNCNFDRVESSLTGIDAVAKRITTIDTSNNYILTEGLNSNSNEIRFDSLAIEVSHELLVNIIGQNVKSIDLGISTAFSCTPSIPDITISSMEITSSQDYDAQHPNGTNLLDLVDLNFYYDALSELEYVENAPFNLNDYDRKTLLITFKTAPLVTSTHTLNIKYTTSDGLEKESVIENLTISN